MNKQFLKNTLGWGFLLWLIGYVLGMILYFIVPASMIGWIITPIGVVITLAVLIKKIKNPLFSHYLIVAIAWALIAIIFDYFFLVKTLKPVDGYYKLDVYLYYILTFTLPLMVGWAKTHKKQ